MVEQFVGTWKLVSSENFEEFLKEIGVGLPIRKAVASVKPNLTVSVDDQGVISLKVVSPVKTREIRFKLNETFDAPTINDKAATNIVTLVNGHLVQKQTCCDGKETIFARYIVDGKLVMVCKRGDVVATRTFEK